MRTTSCIAALTLLPLLAHAQAGIDQSRRNAIVRAIEQVAPAVVTINVVDVQRRAPDPFMRDFLDLFGRRAFGGPRTREVESVGTGVIIDRRGHILTNYHVLQGGDYIASVTLPGGERVDVEIIGGDRRSDLAVLRAKNGGLPYATLGDSDALLIGEWAIAIGNPFGAMMRDPQPSVSVGVISANGRRVSRSIAGGDAFYMNMIQTDAAINPGNSGGPLVNAAGEVVGINTIIFSTTGGHQGLGFAIPANRAQRVAEEIITHGKRRDPWLGFRGERVGDLPSPLVRRLGVQRAEGVVVTEILDRAPAFEAGLRPGDVVTALNGEPVRAPVDLDYLVWQHFPGDPITLETYRGREARTLRFRIEALRE